MRTAFTLGLMLAVSAGLTGPAAAQSGDGNGDDAPPEYTPPINLPRPDPAGTATEVKVGIYVIDITKVSDVEQSFTANFVVRLLWNDPRLASPDGGVRVFDPSEIWSPRVEVLNRRRVFELWPPVVSVDADGQAMYRQRYYGELSSPLDLHDFPLDTQRLPITLVAAGSRPEDVALVKDETLLGRAERLTMAGLSVTDEKVYEGEMSILGGGLVMSQIEYVFDVRRETSYYFWKVFIPLVTIVLMSWASFWIDPKQVGPAVGIATTSVLTLIAYRFLLGNLVPPVPYLTRLDVFILLATILVFAGLVAAVLACNLAVKGKERTAERMDLIARVVFPLGVVAAVLLSLP